MKHIRIIVFFRPGTAHLRSFEMRAERMLEAKVISKLPKFDVEKGTLQGFYVVVITCLKKDWPAWFAFYQACNLCCNNRPLMVGTE